jgi:hypothetical protein
LDEVAEMLAFGPYLGFRFLCYSDPMSCLALLTALRWHHIKAHGWRL